MTVNELLKLIPAKTFRDLAVETKVDAQVKKLSGEVMFKLILFSMLSSDKLSLSVMETFLQSASFKSFSQFDILESKYNSIRDRICNINASYFEKLFEEIFAIYNKELKEENALSKTERIAFIIYRYQASLIKNLKNYKIACLDRFHQRLRSFYIIFLMEKIIFPASYIF